MAKKPWKTAETLKLSQMTIPKKTSITLLTIHRLDIMCVHTLREATEHTRGAADVSALESIKASIYTFLCKSFLGDDMQV